MFVLFFYFLFIGTSLSIPSLRAEISSSASSFVLYADRLILTVESAVLAASPNAVSALLVLSERDEQAEPLEIHISFPERKWSMVSLLMLGKEILII